MEKTQSKPLAAGHGRGDAWARHGKGMVSVNYPLGETYFGCPYLNVLLHLNPRCLHFYPGDGGSTAFPAKTFIAINQTTRCHILALC
jgi:hypothetical protein